MRRKDREVTDVHEKEAILDRCMSGHLSMFADGRPYGVTLNFGWEKDADGAYVLWFHCAAEGRKVEILKANPAVWFFAEREGRFREWRNAAGQPLMTMEYESVAGAGRATFVTDLDAKRHGLGVLCARFTDTPMSAMPDQMVEHTCVFRVAVPSLSAKRH